VLRLPVEQRRVEAFGDERVARRQFRPAEGAQFAERLRADVFPRLPHFKHGARRILQDGHASVIHHVEGGGHDHGAEFVRAGGRRIRVLDGNVRIPMRWRTVLTLLGPHRVRGRDRGALQLKTE
jgi:hypothetical protein